MQTEQVVTPVEFHGTPRQKAIAERLFEVFLMQGRFFAVDAPIRLSASQLAAFMQQVEPRKTDYTKDVTAALVENGAIWAQEEGEDPVFVTTRAGTPPADTVAADLSHTLTRRFATPEPKREPRPTTRKRPARSGMGILDSLIGEPEPLDSPAILNTDFVVVPTTLPTHVEVESEATDEAEDVEIPMSELPEVEEAAEWKPVPDFTAAIIDEASAAVAAGGEVDVATASDDELAAAILTSLANELNVARWGDQWMMEDKVERFSRGDVRRIEDYLQEQGGMATDEEIVVDVRGVKKSSADYDNVRFAVNYRLSRETREFEYLGTANAGLWSLANQTHIPATKRRAADLGQDFRYLLDLNTPSPELEEGIVEHVLTYYEFVNGVLPLSADLASVLPKSGFSDQRAARITFESPQTNDEIVAEVRYPTSNRGGYVAGLDQFFADNLVPGAVLTIEQTDNATHFLLEYFQTSAADRKVLHLDERKGTYDFRSTTFYCAIQDDSLVHEGSFPKLAGQKPLDEKTKRNPVAVVEASFERGGNQSDGALVAQFSDLLALVNVERPMSAELLQAILTDPANSQFSADAADEQSFAFRAQA